MFAGGIMHFTLDTEAAYHDKFLTAIDATGYLWQMIGAVELICAVAILTRRYMPLALVVLAPITIVIFSLHLSQIGEIVYKPGGMFIAVPVALAHMRLAWFCRAHYHALFTSRLILSDAPATS